MVTLGLAENARGTLNAAYLHITTAMMASLLGSSPVVPPHATPA